MLLIALVMIFLPIFRNIRICALAHHQVARNLGCSPRFSFEKKRILARRGVGSHVELPEAIWLHIVQRFYLAANTLRMNKPVAIRLASWELAVFCNMSAPVGIPTLTRSGSKLLSPASSFPSRGGYYRTHSLTEDQQTYPLSHSGSYRSHQEPLLLQEQRSRSRSQGKFRGDEERGLPRREIPTVWHEIGSLCRLAGPMVCVNLLQFSITVVSVAFVGHLGELELASASIANSIAGVIGYYVLVSSIFLYLRRYVHTYWLPICGYILIFAGVRGFWHGRSKTCGTVR